MVVINNSSNSSREATKGTRGSLKVGTEDILVVEEAELSVEAEISLVATIRVGKATVGTKAEAENGKGATVAMSKTRVISNRATEEVEVVALGAEVAAIEGAEEAITSLLGKAVAMVDAVAGVVAADLVHQTNLLTEAATTSTSRAWISLSPSSESPRSRLSSSS